MNYTPNLTLAEAARLVLDTDGPILAMTHAKPDGDAIGSVVALTAALRQLGKPVTALLVPPVTDNLLHFAKSIAPVIYQDAHTAEKLPADPALILVLDTGAYSQLGPMKKCVEQHLDRTLILDHHLSGDVKAEHRFIDPAAAANCEIVARLLDQLEQQGDTALLSSDDDDQARTIREALFIGIASDTGWFRFSNVTPATHEVAARLIRLGVDHADLYRRLEQTERPEKLKLLIRAVASLRMLAGGAAAVMVLRENDFQETGARQEETERLIDIPQQVASVRVICLVTERTIDKTRPGEKHTQTRLSFRSKSQAPGAEEPINVADLAAQFGGGGHARAAGAKVNAPVDEVLDRVTQALESL